MRIDETDDRAKALLIVAQNIGGFVYETDLFRPSDAFPDAFAQLAPDLMTRQSNGRFSRYACTAAGLAADTRGVAGQQGGRRFFQEYGGLPLLASFGPAPGP